MMEQLGLDVVDPRLIHRVIAVMASSRSGAWLMSKVIHRLDGIAFSRSNGRSTVSSSLAGLPTVMISTTGARSGQVRTSPLTAIPLADNVGLVGTNFGQKATPGWVYNLEANPAGVASHGEVTVEFLARPADEDEREEILESAARIYRGYDKYRERVTGRVVRVFVLEVR